MNDVTNVFPYNEIEDRTFVDGNGNTQHCVFIPKFYVKNEQTAEGLITRRVSNVKLSGYHCHPAFMTLGHETEEGLLIQKYLSDTGLVSVSADTSTYLRQTFDICNTIAQTLGMHIINVYEQHMLALLMLIECGTADVVSALGYLPTTANPIWRGINYVYGGVSAYYWIDGIKTDADEKIQIYDNIGNGSWVDINWESFSGYPVILASKSGEGFDLQDLFIGRGSDAVNDINQSTYPDKQNLNAVNCLAVISGSAGDICGPFYLWHMMATDSSMLRMCKLI